MKLSAIITAIAIAGLTGQTAYAQSTEPKEKAEESSKSAPAKEIEKGPALSPPEESFSLEDVPTTAREPSAAALASLEMIDGALKKIDEDIEREGNGWQFSMGDRQVMIVTDPLAERMRIIIPIVPAEALTPDVTMRLMQANFDSALDARYAVGRNILWGTFINSLTGMEEDEFLSGLLQTLNIVQTFGTSFSSGAIVFGGGDSQTIVRDQLEELIKEREKANSI